MLFGRELVESLLANSDFGNALTQLERQFQALDPTGLNGDLRRRFHFVREPNTDSTSHRETLDTRLEMNFQQQKRRVEKSGQQQIHLEPGTIAEPIRLAPTTTWTYIKYGCVAVPCV